jgi:hypothetical protein
MKQLWPNLRYYLRIRLEGLRKTMRNLRQDSWSLSQDLNLGLAKYEVGVLTIWLQCLVIAHYQARLDLIKVHLKIKSAFASKD